MQRWLSRRDRPTVATASSGQQEERFPMSEITAVPEQLSGPPGERKLRGNLGVASIVCGVGAGGGPRGVVGGVLALGVAGGNGAGFPATFVVSTLILLLF